MKENWLEIFVFGVMFGATVDALTLGVIVLKGLFGLECIAR